MVPSGENDRVVLQPKKTPVGGCAFDRSVFLQKQANQTVCPVIDNSR